MVRLITNILPQSETTSVNRTHVTEVVAGESPVAKLAIQAVQVLTVQLKRLAAVQAEAVCRRGDGVLLQVSNFAGLRETRQFLVGRR